MWIRKKFVLTGMILMNLLNEEIRAIQHTMNHIKMAIPFELNYGRKKQMEKDLKELNTLLEEKLKQCEDFKG